MMVGCPKETEKGSGGKVPPWERNSDSLDSATCQWPPPGPGAASESTHFNTWTNKQQASKSSPPMTPILNPLRSALHCPRAPSPPFYWSDISFHCTLKMHNISNYTFFLHNLQNMKTNITFWFRDKRIQIKTCVINLH